MAFLGLDIGTSGCKGALVRADGAVLASSYRRLATRELRPGWREQDPSDWWQAICAIARECAGGVASRRRIKGVGVTAHFPTMALVDDHGEPLRDAILYSDQRARHEAALLDASFESVCGTPVHYRAYLPIAKARWLSRHEPDVLAKARWILDPKDFINLKLTGEPATDPAQQAWSGFFARGAEDPDPALCAFAGIHTAVLPAARPPACLLGAMTRRAAEETGLYPGLPVAVGTGDGIAGILGAGVLSPGRVVDLAGTTGLIGAAVPARAPLNETLFTVRTDCVVPGADLAYCSMANAGNALEWFVERCVFGAARGDGAHVDEVVRRLEAQCAGMEVSSDDPLFIPYLDGAYGPAVDPGAKGAFITLSSRHGQADLFRAVLEGVAFGLADIVDRLAADGQPVEAVRAAGGAARSALWLRIKADATGRTIERVDCPDAGCIGAAMLAAVATGAHASVQEASLAMSRVSEVILPDPVRHAHYRAQRDRWRRGYDALSRV